MKRDEVGVGRFKLVICNHMVDLIYLFIFFKFEYTPSTAELSAAWLKMLMLDLDNTGLVLEYIFNQSKCNPVSTSQFPLPSEP